MRIQRVRKRAQGIGILRLAGQAKGQGAVFGECAHQAPPVIGVFQAIQKHVIDNLAMPKPRPTAQFRQQVRRAGHAFHAPDNHYVCPPQGDLIKPHHGGLHARPAHLVHRGGRHLLTKPSRKPRLPRRRLPLARGQDAPHDELIRPPRPSIRQRPLDSKAAKGCRLHLGKHPLKRAHGCARCPGNDDMLHRGPSLLMLYPTLPPWGAHVKAHTSTYCLC